MLRLVVCLLVCLTVVQAYNYCGASRCPLYEDCCCGDFSTRCCECSRAWYHSGTIGSIVGAVISLVVVIFLIVLCCCCIPGCIMHRRRQPGHVYYQQGQGTTVIHAGGQQGMVYHSGGYLTTTPYPAGYPPPQPQGPAPYPPNAAPYQPNAAAPYYPPNPAPHAAQPPPPYLTVLPPEEDTYESLTPPDTTKPSADAPAPSRNDAFYDNTGYETPTSWKKD